MTLLISIIIGYVLGQISLLFFQDEIFAGIDWVVNKVRGWFGLRPI